MISKENYNNKVLQFLPSPTTPDCKTFSYE